MGMVIFYTCMTGNHGFIPNITNEQRKDFKYICFHENHPEAELNKGWEYVNLATEFDNSEHNLSDQKRQRMVKIIGSLEFLIQLRLLRVLNVGGLKKKMSYTLTVPTWLG